MVTPVTCPDVDALKQLVLGQLPAEEIAALQDRLTQWPNCLATGADLPTEDPLLQALRTPLMAASPEDEAVDRLMEKLRGRGPTSSGGSMTAMYVQDLAGFAGTPTEWRAEWSDILAAPQLPGELGRLGPYRVLRVLGSGGMGIVFEAEDPHLQRPVALKVLKPTMASHPDARERFLREARATAAIQHDHIVTIHHVG